MEPPQLGNAELDPQLKRYHKELLALVAAVLAGSMARSVFQRKMWLLVENKITAAFLLAGGNNRNSKAKALLTQELMIHTRSINLLADDLFNGRYSANDEELPGLPIQTADEGKDKAANRLGIWAVSLAGVYTLGQVYNAEPKKVYAWWLGATEDSCSTCLEASNRGNLTAAEWQAVGLRPQGRMLDCGGWNCLCTLVEV